MVSCCCTFFTRNVVDVMASIPKDAHTASHILISYQEYYANLAKSNTRVGVPLASRRLLCLLLRHLRSRTRRSKLDAHIRGPHTAWHLRRLHRDHSCSGWNWCWHGRVCRSRIVASQISCVVLLLLLQCKVLHRRKCEVTVFGQFDLVHHFYWQITYFSICEASDRRL